LLPVWRQLSVDEAEALFDVLKAGFEAVKARVVVNESLLDLADPELKILDVMFHPVLPRA
jgi:hypothetical protein